MKTSYRWRIPPSGFAPRELVYYYYRKWSSLGECDWLLNNLREKVRVKTEQKAEASLGIMDSQSVYWGDNRSFNGIDENKKVKDVKRPVLVDKNGFLPAVIVRIACVHDKKVVYLPTRCLRKLCCNIKVILADAGYRGKIAEEIKSTFGYILEVIVNGDKVKGFKTIGKR